jgi:hypothetical protein
LARESASDDVNRPSKSSPVERGDVSEYRDARPVLLEDRPAEPVPFAERDGAEPAGSFKPEADAADAAEQVEDAERGIHSPSRIGTRFTPVSAIRI